MEEGLDSVVLVALINLCQGLLGYGFVWGARMQLLGNYSENHQFWCDILGWCLEKAETEVLEVDGALGE